MIKQTKFKTLKLEITHLNGQVLMAEQEFKTLMDVIQWKQVPYFPSRGRLAWYNFSTPPNVSGYNYNLISAKIKGVGGFNPVSEAKNRDSIYDVQSSLPFQPTDKPLESFVTYPHLGFDTEGRFQVTFGDVAPIGGILHSKAVNEYSAALHLFNSNVSSIIPFLVARYDELKFKNSDMGVCICLSPSKHPFRLSEVQYGAALRRGENVEKDKFYDQVRESLDVKGDPDFETTRLETLCKLAYLIGETMREFSLSGLYRYSAELPNFEYDVASSRVVLTDLDSTLPLAKLEPHLRSLQVLRDFSSMIYHFTAKFSTPLALGHYTLSRLLEYNPLKYLMAGYFADSENYDFETITNKLWNAYAPHFTLLTKHSTDIITGTFNQWQRRSYKMDHDLFFILVMNLIYPAFSSSVVGNRYKDGLLNYSDLYKNSVEYLKYRTDYLNHLMK